MYWLYITDSVRLLKNSGLSLSLSKQNILRSLICLKIKMPQLEFNIFARCCVQSVGITIYWCQTIPHTRVRPITAPDTEWFSLNITLHNCKHKYQYLGAIKIQGPVFNIQEQNSKYAHAWHRQNNIFWTHYQKDRNIESPRISTHVAKVIVCSS